MKKKIIRKKSKKKLKTKSFANGGIIKNSGFDRIKIPSEMLTHSRDPFMEALREIKTNMEKFYGEWSSYRHFNSNSLERTTLHLSNIDKRLAEIDANLEDFERMSGERRLEIANENESILDCLSTIKFKLD